MLSLDTNFLFGHKSSSNLKKVVILKFILAFTKVSGDIFVHLIGVGYLLLTKHGFADFPPEQINPLMTTNDFQSNRSDESDFR